MSKEDFIAYYEAHHRLIGEKVLRGYATRYVRGVFMLVDPIRRVEIEFPDQHTADACFAAMADEAVMAEIIADEEKLFERSRIRTFTVNEQASEMPPPIPQA